MKTWQALLASSITALILTACGGTDSTSNQSTEVANPEEAAQNAMHDFEEKMGVMGKMLENPDDFDLATFQQSAEQLAESADKPWEHFGQMNENSDFVAEIEKFKTATASLNTVAQEATKAADVKEAFGAVGAVCQSCHMLPHEHTH